MMRDALVDLRRTLIGASSTAAITARHFALVLRALEELADEIESHNVVVDVLPESAAFGTLIRLRGDATLYMGNGAAQPLSRVVPQAWP